MGFRDDGDAQRHKIDALERELEESRARAEELRAERDALVAAEREDDAGGLRSPGAHPFRRGQSVYVEWNGRWYDAHVVDDLGGSWLITYDGWSKRWDEAVGPSRIASRSVVRPGPRGGRGGGWSLVIALVLLLVIVFGALAWAVAYPRMPGGRGGATAGIVGTPGDPVNDLAALAPGRTLWIEWNGSWYPGVVLEVRGDLVLIHYDEYTSSFDELVPLSRLRLR